MKNYKLTFLFLFTVLTLTSCCDDKKVEPTKVYEKPKGLISNEQANAMEEAYKENQYVAINKFLSANGTTEITDNREVWFSLEELENYIQYVKEESAKQDLENLGIRVYFGAKKDTNNVYKSTIFFFPTNSNVTRSAAKQNLNSNGISGLNYGSSGDPADELQP